MTVKSAKIIRNKIIKNKKGSIIKFLKKNDKFFKSFGEVYFSEIKKNKIKGWNYHKKYTCIISVPSGKVEFKIVGHNQKLTKKIITKKETLIIPPRNWFSFKSLAKDSTLINFLNGLHSDNETKKSKIIKNIKIN
jgi:dTDP-4-dehydrorhamnose 3,5-epimerase-like enzyme|tara:strand:+ start:193 stop:597 length:405 start_codon:yes stop_codon:yes gene_type:complete